MHKSQTRYLRQAEYLVRCTGTVSRRTWFWAVCKGICTCTQCKGDPHFAYLAGEACYYPHLIHTYRGRSRIQCLIFPVTEEGIVFLWYLIVSCIIETEGTIKVKHPAYVQPLASLLKEGTHTMCQEVYSTPRALKIEIIKPSIDALEIGQ